MPCLVDNLEHIVLNLTNVLLEFLVMEDELVDLILAMILLLHHDVFIGDGTPTSSQVQLPIHLNQYQLQLVKEVLAEEMLLELLDHFLV